MAVVKPFAAVRPAPEKAKEVSALPYDVMNREEAAEMAKDNRDSFLHVSRSEIDMDKETSPYDHQVYEKARENLMDMMSRGVMIKDPQPKYYIYRQIMDGRGQTGIVARASIDDYLNNVIKKHEHTRPEKEIDRVNHFDVTNANTEPVFFTYRSKEQINEIIIEWTNKNDAEYDFVTEDDIRHQLWVVDRQEVIKALEEQFEQVPSLYIADGHHRTASAARVGISRREMNPDYTGEEPFNYMMAVIFPDDELLIMDYNRVVKDLNGYSKEEFLEKVKVNFDIREAPEKEPYKPDKVHRFGMYLEDKWYTLEASDSVINEHDPIKKLDVSILQEHLLKPILGIEDPRTDNRIDFVGGIRGLKELELRVSKDMKVAFTMYPTPIEDLFAISDAGEVMPPKSTWFEPKLRSGLFVYLLDEESRMQRRDGSKDQDKERAKKGRDAVAHAEKDQKKAEQAKEEQKNKERGNSETEDTKGDRPRAEKEHADRTYEELPKEERGPADPGNIHNPMDQKNSSEPRSTEQERNKDRSR